MNMSRNGRRNGFGVVGGLTHLLESALLSSAMSDDDENVRRKIHPRDIVISTDDEELAVVVSYVVEITYLDSQGRPGESEKKKEKKKVKLRKHLKPSSNVSKLAGEVMKKCRYIHESKRDDLERAIQELQHLLIRDELRATTKQEGDWWRKDEER
jgi:Kinesin-associated protein (KAP)